MSGRLTPAPVSRFAAGAALVSSASEVWGTPAEVLELVRECYGGAIDLDPCASVMAPEWVGAFRRFTADDDGLRQPWCGRVFMNPPYGLAIGAWAAKFREEFAAGRMLAGVALVPVRTDTAWWAELTAPAAPNMGPLVFVYRGRLRFVRPDGSAGGPAPFPSALVVLGPATWLVQVEAKLRHSGRGQVWKV